MQKRLLARVFFGLLLLNVVLVCILLWFSQFSLLFLWGLNLDEHMVQRKSFCLLTVSFNLLLCLLLNEYRLISLNQSLQINFFTSIIQIVLEEYILCELWIACNPSWLHPYDIPWTCTLLNTTFWALNLTLHCHWSFFSGRRTIFPREISYITKSLLNYDLVPDVSKFKVWNLFPHQTLFDIG